MNKVLIVDDVEITRTLLKTFLSQKGLIVDSCSTGEEALLTVPKFKPDIVLLDIQMPGADGFEVCQWIKEQDENIAVIFITSEKSDEIKMKAFKAGGNDFISKPFEGDMIWEIISKNLKILNKLEDKDKTIYQFQEKTTQYENELSAFSTLKEVGLLSSMISHDINNFLGGILGNIDIIEYSYDRFEIEESCQDIKRAVKNIASLTSQITSVSKESSNDTEKTFNLVLALNDAVNLIELNRSFDVMVNRNYNLSEEVLIKTSRSDITNVFINILKNACEATTEKGNITVSVTKEKLLELEALNGKLQPGEYAIVKFTDDGSGIPQEKLNEIYKPFNTSKKSGSGLGLSSVLKFLKSNNSGMDIDSSVGIGTTVTLYLNCTKRRNHAEYTQAFTKKEYDFTGYSFLVIEDDQVLARGVTKFLTKFNGQCELFDGGSLSEIESNQDWDVIIVDLNYRGQDIKKFLSTFPPNFANFKILVISGEEFSCDHFFLKKPFSFFELADKLAEIIQ